MNMPPGPGRPKGLKNKKTLLMEERRAIFEEEVSKTYLETIKKARPEYILDQFLGKAPDKIEHSGELKTKSDIDIELLAEEMAKKLKEKKL